MRLDHDRVAGDHLVLAGNVKAGVRADDMPVIRAFFARAAKAKADYIASYRLTDAERAASLTDKMSGRYSDY